jgi:excisionase family DNA binding protein
MQTITCEPDFFTVEDVAYLTKTSKDAVYKMIREGQLPAVKIGGSVRVLREVYYQTIAKAYGQEVAHVVAETHRRPKA